jgi:hypothetical protein
MATTRRTWREVAFGPLATESELSRIFCSSGLIAGRDPARDDFGYLKIVASSSRVQAFHDAQPILYLPILAHLPLAFKPRDGKAETYNAAQHDLYVGVRRI